MCISEKHKATLLNMMCEPTLDEEDTTSYFSSQHIMSGKELAGQVFNKIGYILSQLCPEVSATVSLFPIKGNGLQVFVLAGPEGYGYECKVYAVSKKNKICETLIDMFNKPETDLTNVLLEYSGRQGYADPLAELAPVSFSFVTAN